MGMIDDVMTAPAWEAEMGKSTVYNTIYNTAKSSGIDPKELLQLAEMESGFDIWAESEQGYSGLFQLNPNDPDIRAYMGRNLPFSPPSLSDPSVNTQFAVEHYKRTTEGDFGADKDNFLARAINYNQGNKGGNEILAAFSNNLSIGDEISNRVINDRSYAAIAAPWNRTKNILNNLSDKSLNILRGKHKLKKGSREQLIYSMIGDSTNPKHALEDDRLLVTLYVNEQEVKVGKAAKIADKILKDYE